MYLGLYKALGYGVQGSSQYLDPLGRPGQYAAELPGRFAALSGGQIVGAITDVWMFDPRSHMPLVAAGVLGLALFTWLLRGALRDAPEDERRRVRFWLAGALLSLFVVTTGTLGNRLLLAPGLGAFVGIAFVLRHAWRVARRRVPASGPSRVAHVLSVGVLGLVHCVASPLLLAASLESMGRRAAAAVRLTSAENVVPAPGAHVVILATADGIPALFGGGHRMFAPEPRPAGWHLLSVDPVDHRLTRTGPRTLELAVLGDVAGPDPGDLLRRLLRRPEAPLRAGQEVRLDCGHVRVLDAPGGRPVRIEITFDGDIGGPGFSFLVLDEDAFRTVALPEQGSAIEIAIHPPALPF